MTNFGFIASKMDGTEHKFEAQQGLSLPTSYSYRKFLPPVINQGSRPICVPCSVSSFVNWKINLKDGMNDRDNKVNLDDIYKSRSDKGDNGMQFKDALKFLRHEGVRTSEGVEKISRYATIGSDVVLKQALFLNGPCIGGLPVYNTSVSDFWNKSKGDYVGNHAIAIVGYNEDGFIIRNSWGLSYGEKGYAVIPYDDFGKFYEIWTMY